MSKEEQREDSNLLAEVAQHLNLYDNLFPQVGDKELQVLFALIRIYLARCDNPGLKQGHILVNPDLMKRLSLNYFNPFTTVISRGLREALVSRLSSIRKYRITSTEVVRRTLIACLYQEEKGIHTKQKKYLGAFMKNPGKSFTEIAKQLGVTPQAVSQACRSLMKSDLFRFYGFINYPVFRLKHFIAFFTSVKELRRNTEQLRKLLFENMPFTLSLNLDTYEGRSWASFVIPNQNREIYEFSRSLKDLRGEVFQDLNLCELASFSTGSNLEFFDGKSWFFDPQLWAYGFFEFIKENREILRKATELRYSNEPIRFDRIDLMIATTLATNPLTSHSEIGERLRQLGYDLSRPTVTRRVERLTKQVMRSENGNGDNIQPAIYPYLTYWGLGLSNLNAYLIECDQQQVEDICYAVGYLPYFFLYRTDKGVLLFIKSSAEDTPRINYMIKGINEIRVVTYSNRFENIGTGSIAGLSDKWDESKQRWVCANEELNFVKRYERLP